MIKLKNLQLPDATTLSLAGYQREIDNNQIYAAQVAKAKAIWPTRSQNRPFNAVRHTLSLMCSGARRCCYCEDSMAIEVEHIWPKTLYPDKTFLWENLLYACSRCNRPKSNKFAIFPQTQPPSTNYIEYKHPKQGTPVRPPAGSAVFIDPRKEDPMDFLWLDITATFVFVPVDADENSISWKRAKYTIETLKLNSEDALIEARQRAYENYFIRLDFYVNKKQNGGSSTLLTRISDGIKKEGHRTVWKEMQRQHTSIRALQELFNNAPEALNW
jgi:uncharacterized protein (TIGR02646 family)